jgi:hypothetical protein
MIFLRLPHALQAEIFFFYRGLLKENITLWSRRAAAVQITMKRKYPNNNEKKIARDSKTSKRNLMALHMTSPTVPLPQRMEEAPSGLVSISTGLVGGAE